MIDGAAQFQLILIKPVSTLRVVDHVDLIWPRASLYNLTLKFGCCFELGRDGIFISH